MCVGYGVRRVRRRKGRIVTTQRGVAARAGERADRLQIGPVVQITHRLDRACSASGRCGAERIGWTGSLAVFCRRAKSCAGGHCASRTSDRAYVDVLLDDLACRAIPAQSSLCASLPTLPDSLFSILVPNSFPSKLRGLSFAFNLFGTYSH